MEDKDQTGLPPPQDRVASSIATSGRSKVQAELDMLRDANLAKTHKGKFKGSSVPMTAEEALSFLSAQKQKMGEKFIPSASSGGGTDAFFDSWYMQQREMTANEKQKKIEAESLLRGYRASHHQSTDTKTSPVREREWKTSTFNPIDANSAIFINSQASGDKVKKSAKKITEDNAEKIIAEKSTHEDEDTAEEIQSATQWSEEVPTGEVPNGEVQSTTLTSEEVPAEEVSAKETTEVLDEKNDVQIKEPEAPEIENNDENINETKKEVDTLLEKDTKDEIGTDADAPEVNDEADEEEPLEEKKMEENDDEQPIVDSKDSETKAAWRNFISNEENAKFQSEPNRYHLYASMACPWAHRTMLVRAIKGLEDVISCTVLHPIWQYTKPNVDGDDHRGWMFADPDGEPFTNVAGLGGPFPAAFDGNEPDVINHCSSIREVYEKANDTVGKYTVPVLWDKKLGTIVSNESSEIIRMFNREFNSFAKYPDIDLYPDSERKAIDSLNKWIYPTFNNGVYRCGLATTQEEYQEAVTAVTNAFDKIEGILKTQRFLAGENITEADIRLFPTLLRFDEVYNVYFKTNSRLVANSDALLNYCREIYQMPGVAETCDMEQIKYHYYCSHVELNRFSIVPIGTGFMELLSQPHNRESIEKA